MFAHSAAPVGGTTGRGYIGGNGAMVSHAERT